VNVRFDCDAPGDRPNRLSAGQAVSTKLPQRGFRVRCGGGSVATTCSPWRETANSISRRSRRCDDGIGEWVWYRYVISPKRLLDFGVGDAVRLPWAKRNFAHRIRRRAE